MFFGTLKEVNMRMHSQQFSYYNKTLRYFGSATHPLFPLFRTFHLHLILFNLIKHLIKMLAFNQANSILSTKGIPSFFAVDPRGGTFVEEIKKLTQDHTLSNTEYASQTLYPVHGERHLYPNSSLYQYRRHVLLRFDHLTFNKPIILLPKYDLRNVLYVVAPFYADKYPEGGHNKERKTRRRV